MAGTLVPTLVLPLVLVAFLVLRVGMQVSFPIERGLVFPMALVPALWGAWNILWQWSRDRTRLPLGIHGSLLPLLLMPAGGIVGAYSGVLTLGASAITWFNAAKIPYAYIVLFLAVAMTVYYLAWKYIVGFVNRLLGIA